MNIETRTEPFGKPPFPYLGGREQAFLRIRREDISLDRPQSPFPAEEPHTGWTDATVDCYYRDPDNRDVYLTSIAAYYFPDNRTLLFYFSGVRDVESDDPRSKLYENPHAAKVWQEVERFLLAEFPDADTVSTFAYPFNLEDWRKEREEWNLFLESQGYTPDPKNPQRFVKAPQR